MVVVSVSRIRVCPSGTTSSQFGIRLPERCCVSIPRTATVTYNITGLILENPLLLIALEVLYKKYPFKICCKQDV